MLEAIATKIIESAVTVAKDILGARVKEMNERQIKAKQAPIPSRIDFTPEVVTRRLQTHVADIKAWCTHSSFFDLMHRKDVGQIYVNLETYVMPVKTHFSIKERDKKQPLQKTLADAENHCAILGQPGAGKTTSLQKLCVDYFTKGKILINFNFPILIRLRDVRPTIRSCPISEHLCEILGMSITVSMPDADAVKFRDQIVLWKRDALIAHLNALKITLLIDGLDEIANDDMRTNAVADISELSNGLTQSRLILTCRSADYSYEIPKLAKFEIAPLSEEQITAFSEKWLQDEGEAEKFVRQIRATPFLDTAIRPLTLAHLCAIFERVGNIPDEPKTIYRKVVNLLIEEWDEQRSVRRTTSYSKFTADRKFDFLCALAFQLTAIERVVRFDRLTLANAYKRICKRYNLPFDEALPVARELESHTGLLLESSYDTYEFAHKSIQEYLTAEYLVRLPSLKPISGILLEIPYELAIAITLSSDPSSYLGELVLTWLLPLRPGEKFLNAFVDRLILERPEFSSSEEGVLGASALLTKVDSDQHLRKLLAPIFSLGFETILNHYYGMSVVNEDFIKFMGPQHNDQGRLPATIRLPKSYFPKHR